MQQQLVVDVPDLAHRAVFVLITGVVGLSVAAVFAFVAVQRLRMLSSAPTSVQTQIPAQLSRSQTSLDQLQAPAPTSEPTPATVASVSTGAKAAEPLRPAARPRPAQSSSVAAGSLTVSGRLEPKIIGQVVRGNFGRFRMCHEQALALTPNLAGTVKVRFVIGRDGNVSNVQQSGSDLANPTLERCILSAFAGLSFPMPEAGIVTVIYPVILRAVPAK